MSKTHEQRQYEDALADLEAAKARVAFWQRRIRVEPEETPQEMDRPSGPAPLGEDEKKIGTSDLAVRRARRQIEDREKRKVS